MSEWVELLQQNLDGVPKKDLEFAASLLNQAKSGKKPLTDKQMYWVSKLASQAMGIPDFTRPAEVNVGEFTGVIDLFKKAGTTLKYPRITLKTEGGQKLMLTLSGPTSKYPGVVNVTDGAGYGGNIWFGRVEASGKFTPGHASEKIKNDLTSILTKLASRAAPRRRRLRQAYGLLLLLLDPADRPEVAGGRLRPAMRQAMAPPVGRQGGSGVKLIAFRTKCAIVFVGQGGQHVGSEDHWRRGFGRARGVDPRVRRQRDEAGGEPFTSSR